MMFSFMISMNWMIILLSIPDNGGQNKMSYQVPFEKSNRFNEPTNFSFNKYRTSLLSFGILGTKTTYLYRIIHNRVWHSWSFVRCPIYKTSLWLLSFGGCRYFRAVRCTIIGLFDRWSKRRISKETNINALNRPQPGMPNCDWCTGYRYDLRVLETRIDSRWPLNADRKLINQYFIRVDSGLTVRTMVIVV